MPASPRVTVITPSLNQARYIERSICSVLDQGYPDLEHIVVDGGSDDTSVELIRCYEQDLACWRSGPYPTAAAAINWALERATGDYVMVLSGRDLLMPDALRLAAEHMTGPDRALWIVGRTQQLDEADHVAGELTPSRPRGLDRWLMHESGLLPLAGTLVERGLLAELGGMDASLRIAHGYDLTSRLLTRGLQPRLIHTLIAGERQTNEPRSVEDTLREGLELIDVASRHAEVLPATQRRSLSRSLDERRKIYALAEAEARTNDAKRFLWRQLLRHPWWLRSEHYRQALLSGSAAGMTPDSAARRAA